MLFFTFVLFNEMSLTTNGTVKNPTRTIRKVEAPRPLKKSLSETKTATISPLALSAYNIESVDKLVILMDMVVDAILQSEDPQHNMSGDAATLLTDNIAHLCKHLKIFGPQLENTVYQGQLDRTCLIFRDAMVRGSLEYQARVQMLEILELRERSWKTSGKSFFSFTNTEPESCVDLNDLKNYVKNYSNLTNDSNIIGPDEVLRRSNRREKTTSKSSNKNYCKDEIMIRNSDSGKVTPTAKERLVQITGANEENVSYATRLISETIRNNASPVRVHSESESSCTSEDSSADQLGCDEFDGYENGSKSIYREQPKSTSNGNIQPYLYKHKVLLSNCKLTITGDDYTYVTIAKAVLDDYFSKLRKSAEVASENINCDDMVFENVLKAYESNKNTSTSPKVERDSSLSLKPSGSVKKHLLNSPLMGSVTTSSSALEISDSSIALSLPDNNLSADDAVISSPSPNKKSAVSVNSSPNVMDEGDAVNLNQSALHGVIGGVEKMKISNDTPPVAGDESARIYSKELMLELRMTELCQQPPNDWDVISSQFPFIVKVSTAMMSWFAYSASG